MEIDCLQRNNTFKFKITSDRHNAKLKLNNCALLDPPHFSLPSTFKYVPSKQEGTEQAKKPYDATVPLICVSDSICNKIRCTYQSKKRGLLYILLFHVLGYMIRAHSNIDTIQLLRSHILYCNRQKYEADFSELALLYHLTAYA